MRIKSILLENFCSHKKFSADFGKVTHIKGSNEVGKSTIKRAIQFILNSRDENGKEVTGIRPHDSDGVEVDKVETIAEITVEIDGAEYQLKKNYHQDFNKQGEFKGNSTDCYVSDILKKTKDYAEFIDGIIPNEMCINAQSFLRLDMAKRREILEKTFGTHTNESVIAEFMEFEPIRALLNIGTVEELKKRCRIALKGDKSKKGLYDLLSDIPTRIDEVEKQRVDVDTSELELGKKAVMELLKNNQAKQNDVSKQYEDLDKMSDGILELKFQLNDIERKANEGLFAKRKKLQQQIDEVNNKLFNVGMGIQDNMREIGKYEDIANKNETKRKELAEKWKSVKAETFDENTTICPTCKRVLPDDEIEQLKAEFEKNRAERLAKIEKDGTLAKNEVLNAQGMIEKLTECNEQNKANKQKWEEELIVLKKDMEELPSSVDISNNEEYVALQKQIEEKKQFLDNSNLIEKLRKDLKDEEIELNEKLRELDRQIAKADINTSIDERINELQEEQRSLAQKIADQEKELNLLEEFERKKAELLEVDVNNNFEYVKFKMFEVQVNGELKNICQPVVNGESYDRNLNHGNKILTEIDICRAFQKAHNVELPIIVDDCESLDEWRVPKVDNQLILIRRTDDKELKVEVE